MKAAFVFLFGVVCSANADAYDGFASLPVKNDTPDVQQLWVYSYAKEKWHEPFLFRPGDRQTIGFTTGQTFYLVFRNRSQQNQRETPVEPIDVSDVLRQNPGYELSIYQVTEAACTQGYAASRRFRRYWGAAPPVTTHDVIEWSIRPQRPGSQR